MYYEVTTNEILPVLRERKIEIDTNDYRCILSGKMYSVAVHKERYSKPKDAVLYLVDVHFGSDHTILCDHFGELSIVMARLSTFMTPEGLDVH